jgi:hypothetical protein
MRTVRKLLPERTLAAAEFQTAPPARPIGPTQCTIPRTSSTRHTRSAQDAFQASGEAQERTSRSDLTCCRSMSSMPARMSASSPPASSFTRLPASLTVDEVL